MKLRPPYGLPNRIFFPSSTGDIGKISQSDSIELGAFSSLGSSQVSCERAISKSSSGDYWKSNLDFRPLRFKEKIFKVPNNAIFLKKYNFVSKHTLLCCYELGDLVAHIYFIRRH